MREVMFIVVIVVVVAFSGFYNYCCVYISVIDCVNGRLYYRSYGKECGKKKIELKRGIISVSRLPAPRHQSRHFVYLYRSFWTNGRRRRSVGWLVCVHVILTLFGVCDSAAVDAAATNPEYILCGANSLINWLYWRQS